MKAVRCHYASQWNYGRRDLPFVEHNQGRSLHWNLHSSPPSCPLSLLLFETELIYQPESNPVPRSLGRTSCLVCSALNSR